MKKLLQQLTETFGPSGYEGNVREIVRAEVESLADEIRVDALGNLIVRKRPTSQSKDTKKIMIAAHMDEIGIIVSHVDENGFVRFSSIGGVFSKYILGSRVQFLNGTKGIVGYDRLEKVNELPTMDKIYIDVGATSKKDCRVRVGDVAGFDRQQGLTLLTHSPVETPRAPASGLRRTDRRSRRVRTPRGLALPARQLCRRTPGPAVRLERKDCAAGMACASGFARALPFPREAPEVSPESSCGVKVQMLNRNSTPSA